MSECGQRDDLSWAECHCPEDGCGWAGYWDDALVTREYEPMGEAWGSRVGQMIAHYWCPDCETELDAGPPPRPDDETEEGEG